MYNGKCDEGAIEAMCEHLLMAANHYQCDNLKLICQAKLHEGLTVANAAARLVLSEQMDAPKLKEICLAVSPSPCMHWRLLWRARRCHNFES